MITSKPIQIVDSSIVRDFLFSVEPQLLFYYNFTTHESINMKSNFFYYNLTTRTGIDMKNIFQTWILCLCTNIICFKTFLRIYI